MTHAPHPRPTIRLIDARPPADDLRDEILRGLCAPRKTLPAKLFYDAEGSRLFERICELDEYYLTRVETAILRQHAPAMAARIGARALLIEYGSGSGRKTRLLLDHLPDPAAYVAIDISKDHLLQSADALAGAYPDLPVIPICADYTAAVELPAIDPPPARRTAYFPGSSIGNFHPDEAQAFLQRIAGLVGPGGGLLIGIDLKKDAATLNLAYNDRAGVTAAFNLNLLARLNREFGTDFDGDRFRHHAFYNEPEGRIEMHLVSLIDHTVRLDRTPIDFRAGESILTEVSYKYDVEEFARLTGAAGFDTEQVWMDDRRQFGVLHLVAR